MESLNKGQLETSNSCALERNSLLILQRYTESTGQGSIRDLLLEGELRMTTLDAVHIKYIVILSAKSLAASQTCT